MARNEIFEEAPMHPTLSVFNRPVLSFALCLACVAFSKTPDWTPSGEFDFSRDRTPQVRYYNEETVVSHFGLDGSPKGKDRYTLKIRYTPATVSGARYDSCTCRRFTAQSANGPAVSIPALENWTYAIGLTDTGIDEKGQVFGIDHSRFDNLKDSNGQVLIPNVAYAVYNTFIDFHSFCDVLGKKTDQGNGIQNLKRIGQKIIHAAAFTQPPVNLGSQILPGSFFKNGEITLEFKGLSFDEGVACALIGFDSGESSFKMLMKPMPNMDVQAVGRSHYFGDQYLELDTQWIRRVELSEVVIAEAVVSALPNKVNEVIERWLVIHSIPAEAFDLE
jgi:hypothetical protein